MKKENLFIIVAAIIVLVLLCIGVGIGEIQSSRLERIERVEDILDETARRCGYISLGVIDGTAISKKNGYMYDGPAIRAELFKRIGEEVPENSWAFDFGEKDGIYLVRFVEYKGQQHGAVMDQEIERTYIYGVY